jgi:probable HAF family extracellular repeat protein
MSNSRKPAFPIRPLAMAVSLLCMSNSYADGAFNNVNSFAGSQGSTAQGVSADGTAVAGGITMADGTTHVYIWNNGTTTDLTPTVAAGTTFGVDGLSQDGNVVVGSFSSGGLTAFRYQVNTGTLTLLQAGGSDSQSIALAVSGDGNTAAGFTCSTGCPVFHAAEWLNGSTTAVLLPDLHPGQLHSEARGVNQDGSVVVGYATDTFSNERAAYWTGGNAYDLGTIAGSTTPAIGEQARANAVSADGAVVVGRSSVTSGGTVHATLWNVATPTAPTAVDLGALTANGSSTALGVSANGKVVVGSADFAANPIANSAAFRWTQATGMQSVTQWLANAGVTVSSAWELDAATATNQDGSVVVGNGNIAGQQQGWVARVGSAPTTGNGTGNGGGSGSGGTGIIEIDGYNTTLVESASGAVQAGTGMPNLTIFGAHHRSSLDSGLVRSGDSTCAWATADAADNGKSNSHVQLTEAGVCKDVDRARFGIGIGQAWAQQDWSSSGGAHYNGQYLIVEGAQAFDNGLEPSVLGYYGRFNSSLDRHYINGGSIDGSSANPDAHSYAVRLRLDWKNAARFGAYDISPYAAYTWIKTSLDAYTETGGGFPAQFAASGWTTNDLRVGSSAATALSSATDLHLSLEGVHRAEGSTDSVNGQVIGLWNFSLPGQTTRQNWGRTTIDIDHRLSDSMLLTVGANLATPGGDARWGVTAGVRATF